MGADQERAFSSTDKRARYPHRHGAFTFSTNPLFAEKTRDIVGLYLAPPLKTVVVWESTACLHRQLALSGSDSVSIIPITPAPPRSSVAVIASHVEVTASHVAATPPAITTEPDLHQAGSEGDLARLTREISGRVRPTVVEIRRYLGCSQARALRLRRQLSASTTKLSAEAARPSAPLPTLLMLFDHFFALVQREGMGVPAPGTRRLSEIRYVPGKYPVGPYESVAEAHTNC